MAKNVLLGLFPKTVRSLNENFLKTRIRNLVEDADIIARGGVSVRPYAITHEEIVLTNKLISRRLVGANEKENV
jgi:hypothetical protein